MWAVVGTGCNVCTRKGRRPTGVRPTDGDYGCKGLTASRGNGRRHEQDREYVALCRVCMVGRVRQGYARVIRKLSASNKSGRMSAARILVVPKEGCCTLELFSHPLLSQHLWRSFLPQARLCLASSHVM